MLEKYDTRENKWLMDIFKLKEKWAPSIYKDDIHGRNEEYTTK